MRAYSHPHGAKSFSTPGVRRNKFLRICFGPRTRALRKCGQSPQLCSVLHVLAFCSTHIATEKRGWRPAMFCVPRSRFAVPFTALHSCVRGRRNPRPALFCVPRSRFAVPFTALCGCAGAAQRGPPCSVFRVPGLLFRLQPFTAEREAGSGVARPALFHVPSSRFAVPFTALHGRAGVA